MELTDGLCNWLESNLGKCLQRSPTISLPGRELSDFQTSEMGRSRSLEETPIGGNLLMDCRSNLTKIKLLDLGLGTYAEAIN